MRLDAWHFMRRIALGCTTDSHPLYGTFMGCLSQCIFEWSSEDLEKLKTAKVLELAGRGITNPSNIDVTKSITRKELALHCRCRTRGADVTVQLISELLDSFSGSKGMDTLGVPLLDSDRVEQIWQSQAKHVACIQDPERVQLYSETGKLIKCGVSLPVLRCARGSTSLEFFHLHVNRFIPGTVLPVTGCIMLYNQPVSVT